MNTAKKIIGIGLAAAVAVGGLSFTQTPAYAINFNVDRNEFVYDYDPELFKTGGEWNDDVIKIIEAATKCDYDEITFAKLEGVKSLDLSGLELEAIPGFVQYMTGLKTLDLSENRLRNAGVNNFDLSYCVLLNSVDISDNYLTTVPSWFVALDLSKKDISNNLIDTANQRSVELTTDTFYFVIGDKFDEKKFKDKVLSGLIMSDGTELPDFFFDPELPTYDIPDEFDDDPDYERNYDVVVDLKISSFISDGEVAKPGTVTGSAGIITAYENNNTNAEFVVHFIEGNAPSSIKTRLQSLIDECDKLDKSIYTAGSWSELETALKTAKALVSYENADFDMLSNAYDTLSAAKKKLHSGVSADTKKVLNDLVAVANTYKEADYSAESWKRFQKAVTALKEAASDADTSIEEANLAIKAFQLAQSELAATDMVVPEKILKADFQAVYGEDKVIVSSGATRNGYKYKWEFNGNDVVDPRDFNPEIKYESQNEDNIRFEVGSASDYQLISFAETNTFPGTATVTLDVSAVYGEGVYRLYKVGSGTVKSVYVKDVTVKDGSVSFTVSEGGDYYISSVMQNFALESATLEVRGDKLTLVSDFGDTMTVAELRASLAHGEYLTVAAEDGSEVLESEMAATGMTVSVPGGNIYTVIIMGDCNGDGYVNLADALATLKAASGVGETLVTYAQKAAADVNENGWVFLDDALMILKRASGVE